MIGAVRRADPVGWLPCFLRLNWTDVRRFARLRNVKISGWRWLTLEILFYLFGMDVLVQFSPLSQIRQPALDIVLSELIGGQPFFRQAWRGHSFIKLSLEALENAQIFPNWGRFISISTNSFKSIIKHNMALGR